jgi:hypothetical protein
MTIKNVSRSRQMSLRGGGVKIISRWKPLISVALKTGPCFLWEHTKEHPTPLHSSDCGSALTSTTIIIFLHKIGLHTHCSLPPGGGTGCHCFFSEEPRHLTSSGPYACLAGHRKNFHLVPEVSGEVKSGSLLNLERALSAVRSRLGLWPQWPKLHLPRLLREVVA